MGSIPPELSLDVTPTYISKTISCFLGELTTIGRVSERLLKLDDFMKQLEEEMRKIDAFKRELPLCMLLLKDAIVTLKEESMKCRARNVEPVLEEFMPLKKDSDEDEESEVKKEKNNTDKMNWMSTVQLWNNYKNIDSNFDRKQNPVAQFMKGAEAEYRHSSNDCSVFPAMETPETRKKAKGELPVAGISLLMPPGSKNPREETWGGRAISCSVPNSQSNLRTGPQPPERQSGRKQRRCWSPELHRRFVNALQQLGGSQVATPKQIRDLMQVDGLTNDEVKSHLQKYRLHTKRLPNATTTPEKQSMVILGGGLWMPLDQHSESSRQSSSQSGSPQGPLQLAGTGRGTSGTGSDIVDEEEEGEEDEEKSESNNWKIHIPKTGILQIKPMQGRT